MLIPEGEYARTHLTASEMNRSLQRCPAMPRRAVGRDQWRDLQRIPDPPLSIFLGPFPNAHVIYRNSDLWPFTLR